MKNYKTVLIVEDDQDLALSMARSFVRREYEVKTFGNVRDAIEGLKNFHPRYAVIDLKMPGESGLEMIKHLHQFDDSIKIVMLTGYASITTTIEAIKSGACYYLAKPANVDRIIEAFGENSDYGKIDEAKLSGKKTSIKNLEWEYINQVLMDCNFNVSKAARMLGMQRRTLARKLEKRHVS
jgi:two-component system response regulator RegA